MLEHKSAIAIAGAAFLVSMGVYFAFFKKAHMPTDSEGKEIRFRKRDMARIFASGFIINTLNPGVILFWLGNATVLSVDHTLKERIIIFSVCLLVNMGADVLKVMMAGKLRSKLTLRTLTIINKISGSLLIAFGLALVLFSHRIMH
jgi:threonine/homoserine/homoserine lactone efflux protein